ncbi:MAG: UDP-N-acetylmuramoyl-tripeptide--D-alanyl-D-alanine ligase [Flavobacteriaceae bacterium]|nr:UDP-N-acetylmuramoyl-tripeptide--D-alanyl-D-alanine ligase [Flavobacteriaceae bacterium]
MKIKEIHRHFLNSSGISTDTRNIKNNSLFFALKGDHFNGNEFAHLALDKGACKVIIDEKKFMNDHSILVPNVLKTLQELASFHRTYLNIPIIALTGSNGKTTTKELVNVVLSKKFKTVATSGNFNNHIGVPLTLLNMDKSTELGIVEMGANHPGEIELLCAITKPDYGYITNFGKAHIEGFGSLEGVIKSKSELYRYLRATNKTVFVNDNDKNQKKNSEHINKFTFGDESQNCTPQLIDSSNELLLLFEGLTIQSHLIGHYNFNNIAAAITMGSYFGIDRMNIKKAIESYVPNNNRSQIIKKETNTIILDAYNANPTSMMAALKNFIQSSSPNKIVFLGDMFELGVTSEEEHQYISDYIEKYLDGECYLIGNAFYKTTSNVKNIKKYPSFENLKPVLESTSFSNTHVLIKASRGMALERILNFL